MTVSVADDGILQLLLVSLQGYVEVFRWMVENALWWIVTADTIPVAGRAVAVLPVSFVVLCHPTPSVFQSACSSSLTPQGVLFWNLRIGELLVFDAEGSEVSGELCEVRDLFKEEVVVFLVFCIPVGVSADSGLCCSRIRWMYALQFLVQSLEGLSLCGSSAAPTAWSEGSLQLPHPQVKFQMLSSCAILSRLGHKKNLSSFK